MATGYQGYAGYGSPEQMRAERARALAESLQQGVGSGPTNLVGGLSRLGQAWLAQDSRKQAEKAETAYADSRAKQLAQFFAPPDTTPRDAMGNAPDTTMDAAASPAPTAAPMSNDRVKALASALGGSVVPEGTGAVPPMGAMSAPLPPVGTDAPPMPAMAPPQAPASMDQASPVASQFRPIQRPPAAPDRNALLMQAMQMTGGNLQEAMGLVEAKLGPTPKPLETQFFNTARGIAQAGPDGVNMVLPIEPEAKPISWQTEVIGNRVVAYNPQDPSQTKDMGPAPPKSESSVADTFRPATPEDLRAWNIPEGAAVKINNRTGEPQIISGARPASEYTPTQQNKFIQQAGVLDSMEGALNTYRNLVKTKGPQVWTTGIGGDNPTAKELDAARTAVLIQAKELFNLGVLNGPDLDIIGAAVPDVTGWDANGKSYESVNSQLGVLGDYISRGRNQIPPEFVTKARPNGGPPNSQAQADPRAIAQNPAMKMAVRAYAQQTGMPAEAITEFLSNPATPQEIAEFNGAFGQGKAEAILKALHNGG